jgi:hypothetical protein|eukprot:g971.t1 g971   contig10:1095810-1096889(+)
MATILRLIAAFLALYSTSAFTQPSSRISPRFATTGLQSTVAKTLPDGVSKTVTVEGNGRAVRAGDVVIVKYVCKAADSDSAFARAERQRVIVGDGTMIPGWDMAVRTMKEGERASVRIADPQFGYGAAGVPPFVPANAMLDLDIEIVDVEENSGFATTADMGGSALDMDGPINRPRTPGAIAAAYEQKMRDKAVNAPEEKEGVAWAIDKIKGSYFFGLFEGETGQEAPWYLKPSITFPIAFAVVGLAFWASLAGGAISERGMPSTDELDEIIISSTFVENAITMAASNM